MELRKAHNLTVQAREPADRTTKIAIILIIGGLCLYALPSLFAYTMKAGFEKALKHGDGPASAAKATRPEQSAKAAQPATPAPAPAKPVIDRTAYATSLTNVAGERRILGAKITRLIIVGVDFQATAGAPHALDLSFPFRNDLAFAIIAGEPIRYRMSGHHPEIRVHAAFDGALPTELGAHYRALAAIRDANLPPSRPVPLDTADTAARGALCTSLSRWIDYYGVPLEEVSYHYMLDPKDVSLSTFREKSKGNHFKVYEHAALYDLCPSLRRFGATEARRSKF